MLKIIREILIKIIHDIDTGNSNLSEIEALEVINNLKRLSDKDIYLSKYESCKYLNISRATFDNLVAKNKIPKGIKRQGFKELSWNKKDLQELIKKNS